MKGFLFLIILGIPVGVSADVIINEIAWMGTINSANEEWIELYNNGGEEINLEGWILTAVDGTPTITLTGAIGGNALFLLERSSDATVPNVTADLIYSGALGNTGEHLQLKNSEGVVIDEVQEWVAGNNITKETMQLSGSEWITAPGTPKDMNATQGNEENIPSPPVAIGHSQEKELKPVIKDSISITGPSFATRGVSVEFSPQVNYKNTLNKTRGKFEWFMGDGRTYLLDTNDPVSHIFYYPGEYSIVLNFYGSVLDDEPIMTTRQKITIVDHMITIAGFASEGGVILENSTEKEIDLWNWKIISGGREYVFPKYTLVYSKKSLILAPEIIGFYPTETLEATLLLNPTGKEISRYSHQKISSGSVPQEVTRDASVSELGDWVNTPAVALHQELHFWDEYKWYVIAGAVAVGLILAYFMFDLYATRHTLASLEDADEDI